MSVLGSILCIQIEMVPPIHEITSPPIKSPSTTLQNSTCNITSQKRIRCLIFKVSKKQNLKLSTTTTSQIQSSLLPKGFSGNRLKAQHNTNHPWKKIESFIFFPRLNFPHFFPPNFMGCRSLHLQTMTFLWTVQGHWIPGGFGHSWRRHGEA